MDEEINCDRKTWGSRYMGFNGGEGPYGRSVWKGIMNLFQRFKGGIRYEVGNIRIRFSDDRWCSERPLKELSLEVYGMAANQDTFFCISQIIISHEAMKG